MRSLAIVSASPPLRLGCVSAQESSSKDSSQRRRELMEPIIAMRLCFSNREDTLNAVEGLRCLFSECVVCTLPVHRPRVFGGRSAPRRSRALFGGP